jgi:hypothetical protein
VAVNNGRARGRISAGAAGIRIYPGYTAKYHRRKRGDQGVLGPPMYLMYGDEADHTQGDKDFIVCGAIFIDAERAKALHDAVNQARRDTGFASTDSLKSGTNTKPDDCSPKTHTDLKNRVLELAEQHGVIFAGYVCSHAIAKGAPGKTSQAKQETAVQWGFNELLKLFNDFLVYSQTFGLVILDRRSPDAQFTYMQKKFQVGLEYQASRRRLGNIISYSLTCDGCSHLSSVADIVIGAFRYCVNEPNNEAVGGRIYPLVAALMWKRNGKLVGLKLNPAIGSTHYAHQYDALIARLEKYLKRP